jgi:hypothetical protein
VCVCVCVCVCCRISALCAGLLTIGGTESRGASQDGANNLNN